MNDVKILSGWRTDWEDLNTPIVRLVQVDEWRVQVRAASPGWPMIIRVTNYYDGPFTVYVHMADWENWPEVARKVRERMNAFAGTVAER
jgi:hypothetical protein